MSLKEYKAKRSFKTTPEPEGHAYVTRQRRFVIQKHHATALHYDLRLEHRGTMLSWAVPKGPSDNPAQKHLAQAVEDHPLEYRHFEGVIPSGYGAGTVMVWDFGTFDWVTNDDKVKSFILHGKKMQGEYALVRFKKGGPNAWLLLKKKDEHVKKTSNKVITEREPSSAITGRTLNQISSGASPSSSSLKQLPGSKRGSLPRTIKPMKAKLVGEPFNDHGWLFETKWDGFRAIITIDKGRTKVVSRNNLDLAKRFPQIADLTSAFAVKSGVFDAELVKLDKKGTSRFSLLAEDAPGKLGIRVFDVLHIDGFDLQRVPLIFRKKILRAVVRPHPLVTYTDHVEGAGSALFAQTKKTGEEGIIAKQLDSQYKQGTRTSAWLKIKHSLQQEFVIGGWTKGSGSRKDTIGSLLLGVYKDKKMRFVGKVGTGFNEKNLGPLLKKLNRRKVTRSPFAGEIPNEKNMHFVSPTLVAEIKFAEWTPDGHLRQPVFLGLRMDKKAAQVIREQPIVTTFQHDANKNKQQKTKKVLANARLTLLKQPEQEIQLADNTVKLTNLNKVFSKSDKAKKRDIINYYYRIAPVLLPHMANRPVSLKRYPDGIGGSFFYQKHAPSTRPRFVQTIKITHSTGPVRYVMINNIETLVWVANLADIEMHPWYSRKGSLNYADTVVFDLDPTNDRDLAGVRAVALAVKEVLDELGLDAYAKSSGSRGIHIYVPVSPGYTYTQTRTFAKRVAQTVHTLQPKKTTLEFYKAKRRGVYIDYLQNTKGKTLASAYSMRALSGLPVSAPLTWEEVKKGFKIKDFSIKNMPDRLEQVGDLFAPVLSGTQKLDAALKKISDLDLKH